MRYRRTLAAFVLCVALTAVFVCYNRSQINHHEGWKTTKELNQPFQNAVITNGRKPAPFDIKMLEPSQNVKVDLSNARSINIIAQIQFNDSSSLNSDIAPYTVIAYLRRDKKRIASTRLDPFERKELAFIYNGTLDVPKKNGDYRLEIEVKYSIFDDTAKETIELGLNLRTSQFTKNLEGVMLHVSN